MHLVPNEGAADPFKMWYPSGIYRRWRNTRIMNAYIGKVLDERFAKREPDANGAPPGQKKQRKRAVIDLALEAYRAQMSSEDGEKLSNKAYIGIDKEFREAAITQMRTFVIPKNVLPLNSVINLPFLAASYSLDTIRPVRRYAMHCMLCKNIQSVSLRSANSTMLSLDMLRRLLKSLERILMSSTGSNTRQLRFERHFECGHPHLVQGLVTPSI